MGKIRRALLSPYHFLWAIGSAFWYGFPAKKLTVIAVTGTKGKSSVSEMLFSVLTAAGHKTAVAGTIRFAIGEHSRPNLYKMTLSGRGFIQHFLAQAVEEGATHAVIEVTSEAALQHRHLFLFLNALVFTNLEPEHIESHGSMEKYLAAKLKIGRALVHSDKRPRAIIANSDSPYGKDFLALPVEQHIPYGYLDAQNPQLNDGGVSFVYSNTAYTFPHPGTFSIMNALAVIKTGEFFDVSSDAIQRGLASLTRIPGRVERIEVGQNFDVIVDYAHTPGSLKALYEAFGNRRKICVLGNTGGGRDTWKRPEMGKIADEMCAEVILTNEDPYDEDPKKIVTEMAAGMKRTSYIIIDRREAIRAALATAHAGDVVLITGKGTDPYVMGARGVKVPWSDARVVKEELEAQLLTK